MKRAILTFSVVFFLLTSLNAPAQNEQIVLQPENGKQYIYEFQEITYIENNEGEKRNTLIKKMKLEIGIDSVQYEGEKYLFVRVIQNTVEDPNSNITCVKDYKYPECSDGFYDERPPDFYEGLLCRVTYKYSLESKTSKLKLENRQEVLEKMSQILAEKGFEDDEIKDRIKIVDQEALKQITSSLNSIYHINLKEFNNEIIDSIKFKTQIVRNPADKEIIQVRTKNEPGLIIREFYIDRTNKHLTDYYTIELDTIKKPNRSGAHFFHKKYKVNKIHLGSYKNIKRGNFILSGIIENPGADKVTLAFLKYPFGNELHQETVFLDEKNSFRIETKLNRAGLVFLQFGIYHSNNNPPAMCLYAEPGSEIRFEAKGESFPWEIEFMGEHSEAEKLLYDFRKKYKIFHEVINFNRIYAFFRSVKYPEIIEAHNEFSRFTETYKNNIPENEFNFITNELKAFLYNAYFNIYAQYSDKPEFPFGFSKQPIPEDIDLTQIHFIIDTLDLDNIYDEYGVYSRILAQNYFMYHFIEMQKVKEMIYQPEVFEGLIPSFHYINDLEYNIQMARAVLTGHPLYHQLVQILSKEQRSENQFLTRDKSLILKKLDEYFDLMIRRCNDNEFVKKIKKIKTNTLQWQNEHYVPDVTFYNVKGEVKKVQDFFGKKPTIIYVTSDWAVGRYYWDRIASDNPELNVVLVTDGTSYKEWKNYTLKAEPIASQLFLDRHEQDLLDVFMNNSRHYVAYDKNGKLLGFSDNEKEIVKIAKQSLKHGNRTPNKSQLITIIIILGSLLFISLLIFMVWRWHTRQRFRKEEQKRRLRELELTAIRSQMNPHFLFNCLNSVQNLVQQNKGREAHLYLADFAGLIRKVLQNSEKEELSLAEELQMTEQYLNLEKLRFNFDFSLWVEDSIDTHNTLVPSMLLQPFAENAVIHGLQNKEGERKLRIEVERRSEQNLVNGKQLSVNSGEKEKDGIAIIIEDNGIGRTAAQKLAANKNGKGSKLVKERFEILQQKQGEKYRLQITDLNENGATGTRVEIWVPEEK